MSYKPNAIYSPTGDELVTITPILGDGMAASIPVVTTTQAIANLAITGPAGEPTYTPITTVGAGVLTSAALAGGVIARSGPVGNFTDTTATAAQIYTQLGSKTGVAFYATIKNTTPFLEIIAAGTGVTLPTSVIVPANSAATYLISIVSATAVTFFHVETVPLTTNALEVITPLTTVGAGTITGAGIAGGVTVRTGSVAAFVDNTDSAANIIAAMPNAHIGQSFEYTYFNNTGFVATIAGGTGVTASAIVNIGEWTRFLVTYTATNTVTIAAIASGYIGVLPPVQFSTGTTTTTFTAGELTGANLTVYTNTGATPGSIATRTATQMIGDIPGAYIGQSWNVRVINGQGVGTLTVTGGTGVTLPGTATIAIDTWREFACIITSIATPAITMQNIGTGTFS